MFGLPCRGGTEVDDFERSGTLARSHVVRGVELPSGAAFHHDVDDDALIVTLPMDTNVLGWPVPAESKVEFPKPGVLDGVSFASSLLAGTPRGLAAVVIRPSRSMSRGHSRIGAEERLELRRDGTVQGWLLRAPREISGHALETGYVQLDREERLESVLLYRDQRIAGVPCFGRGLAGTDVRFHPLRAGEERPLLRDLVLAAPHALGGTMHPRGTRLRLTRSGQLVSARDLRARYPGSF